MIEARQVFDGLHEQLRNNRDLLEMEQLRDAIIVGSREGKQAITWNKTVIDDAVIDALLSEGVVVIHGQRTDCYVIDWSAVYSGDRQ